MKKRMVAKISLLLAILLVTCIVSPVALATDGADDAVSAVIEQLEAIDTLQEIQAARYSYTVKNNHYDINTTKEAIITEHESARVRYETYVSEMLAARSAAQKAYDALTPAQQAQIDPALVAKLNNSLPTVFKSDTYAVSPRYDDYRFEAVLGAAGMGYEISNHMVAGNIPQTFVVVDTSNGATTWTPDGPYVCGQNNYDVAYCCDVETDLEYGTDYRRINLEDGGYFGEAAARRVRAVVQNAYPFVTIEQMKANLKAGGLDAAFVDSLTRADLIAAVQLSIWTYANVKTAQPMAYFASVSIPKNVGIYFTPIHDYSNELWDWFPGKRQRTFDARAQYRVNNLAYYLCNLPGVSADVNTTVVSQVDVTRAEVKQNSDGSYKVGMYIHLNSGGSESDDLKVVVTSYQIVEGGVRQVTSRVSQPLAGRATLDMTVRAKQGDTIEVAVEGTQKLGKGVYFYEAEGGRDVSQSLVGVAEGETEVYAVDRFTFREEIDEMGLRIYKTVADTGEPLSDIVFDIYSVNPAEGEAIGEKPTEEELQKYKVEENKVATLVTDTTGYAETPLAKGIYLVVEQHNAEKVKSPVDPFYIRLPMPVEVTKEDGTIEIGYENVVSVYPKNEPIVPPPPPPPPPPENVEGKFEILKQDAEDKSIHLAGAVFEIYKAATDADTNSKIIWCNGKRLAVVPVTVGGSALVLTTGEDGRAVSPNLDCGTYFVLETKAPDGYKLPEEAVSVTVVSNALTSHVVLEVANERGAIMPETGGIGTTIFLVVGGILAVGAAILLVTKKRMNSGEEE